MAWLGIPESYDEYIGFVYEIEEIDTGMKYIGIKKFWTTVKKKPTKFRMKDGVYLKDKKGKRITNTRTTKEHIKKESDWRKYNSSSPILQEKIKQNPDNYKKKIISCHKSVTDLKIEEAYLQIKAYKSGNWDKYYNNMINLRLNIR